MPQHLKTGWKRIGRSGPTVDGRTISEQDIIDASETYDPSLYAALIWPDHMRFFNMGKVEAVRHEPNDEGGVDLYAMIAPNDIYMSINNAGQRLFTSMELLENFRGSGRTYLAGLGATDNPASAATEEMRFSRCHYSGIEKPAIKLALHTENTTHDFHDQSDDEPPGWFKKLFSFNSNQESDMDKKALETLRGEFTALTEQFTALAAKLEDSKGGKPTGSSGDPAGKTEGDTGKFSALEQKLTSLTEQFSALEARLPKDDDNKPDQFEALQKALDELTEKFNKAVGEQPGTQAGEDTGGDDLKAYI